MLKVGDKVAGYEVVAELKSGGMATLYMGRRAGMAGFAKHVAIKVIHPHLGKDEKFIDMFLDEARLSARIEHPNVVHVQDLGEEDGMYFMVMEYMNGCSLAQLLRTLAERHRKMSTELAVWLAMRVAAGLHAAHDVTDESGTHLGVVHRDVSPQNVLVAYKGYVKLIDFGIAKAAGRSHQTSTGLLKGKFRYMSPEQAAGKRVDRRTDVYALGVMLWEMLTMRKAFDADNELALLDQVRSPQMVPPSTFAPEVPPELDDAVMYALAVDRDRRPPTAHDFVQALAHAVPEALTVDTPQISELVRTVMAGAIDEDRRRLPNSISGQMMSGTERPREGERVVEVMTMSLDLEDLEPTGPSMPTYPARRSARPPPPDYRPPVALAQPPPPGAELGLRTSSPHREPLRASSPQRDPVRPYVVEGQAALAPESEATPAPGTSSGVVRAPSREPSGDDDLRHETLDALAAEALGRVSPRVPPRAPPGRASRVPLVAAIVAAVLLVPIGVGVLVAKFVLGGPSEPAVIQLAEDPAVPGAAPVAPGASEAPAAVAPAGLAEGELPVGETAADEHGGLAADAEREEEERRRAEEQARARAEEEERRRTEEAERLRAERRAQWRERTRPTDTAGMTEMGITGADDIPLIEDVSF